MKPDFFKEQLCKQYKLTPITMDDAEFLLAMRQDSELNKYLNNPPESIDAQTSWMEKYFDKDDDLYFTVRSIESDRPAGAVALYNIEYEKKRAEWGRWMIKGNPAAAVESLYMMYKFAFEAAGMQTVHFTTVTKNKGVLSIHKMYGAEARDIYKGYLKNQNGVFDEYYFEITAEDFENTIKPKLKKILRLP